MVELEALLRACLAAPGDSAPRLILADWFEEGGGFDVGECPLRSPGYWWLVPDQTRLQVASVAYWRAPNANRVLIRLGSVADFRVTCRAGDWLHSDARTWMGSRVGWACARHTLGGRGFDGDGVGVAVLSAEATFISNRSPRGRFKRRLVEG